MISEFNEEITKQFKKRKLVPYSVHLDIADMATWSESVAKKHGLDKRKFEKYVKELFWGLVSIQLSLGYSLVSLNDTQHPSGKKGVAVHEREIPDMGLPDIHFWHHLHNAWESIYRFWERAVSVLEVRLTPNITKSLYFDGYLNQLKRVESLSEQDEILALYKFNKAWGKITEMRNRVSHEESNPCSYFNVEVEFSSILGIRGGPIPKYNYQLPNLKQEIDTVINSYKKSHDLLYAVKTVCDSNIKPNHRLKLTANRGAPNVAPQSAAT